MLNYLIIVILGSDYYFQWKYILHTTISKRSYRSHHFTTYGEILDEKDVKGLRKYIESLKMI
jgi:predicted negative regulator of RcsB-dependent stress response